MPKHNLAESLRKKMQDSILRGSSIRARSLRAEASFTISMGDAYDYNILGDELDPDDLHREMLRYSADIAEILQAQPPSPEVEASADNHVLEVLSRMVFGSNYIERAGAGLDITLKLCQAIFRGETIPDTIDERDPEYETLKRELVQKGMPATTPFVLRSRREIVQHAKAASYLMTEVNVREKDISEEIILETHRILTHGIDTEQGYSWTEYSGAYRQHPVAAGLHSFPPPDQVPSAMRRLIASLQQDLEDAMAAGKIDPVTLASKYCHMFVNIHPFLDGNGRTCRLILNALLLKYGGFLVSIGQEDETREKYLEIATSLREGSDCDDWDPDDKHSPQHYKQLSSFTLKHATEGLRRFFNTLRSSKGNSHKAAREE
ncbi:hypothetical protein OQA88_117 [Cercophora sp. LCS_1]